MTDNAPIRSRWTVSRCMGRRDERVTNCSGKRTRAAGGERLTQAGRGTYPEDLGESEHVSVRPFPTSALVAHVRIITLPCLKDELRGYNTIPHLVFYPWQLLLTAVLSDATPFEALVSYNAVRLSD